MPPSAPSRLVVLASGVGSLAQSLLSATREPGFPASIVAIGVDRTCGAIDVAQEQGLPHFRVRLKDFPDRAAWDAELTARVADYAPDLIVAAGFMKLLGPHFLGKFAGRVINTHPALLPAFPGAHAVPDALAAGVKITGTTVHLVDEGLDTGPILAQEAVPVHPSDDEAALHERIKTVERRLLVDVVAAIAQRGLISDGRKATIS